MPTTPALMASNLQPCNGEDLVLTTAAQNGPSVEYLWYFGNSLLTTTTAPSLLLNNVNQSNSGNYSVVVRRGSCESDASPLANIAVTNVQNIAPIMSVTDDVLCQGEILGLGATGVPNGASYQWFFNNGTTILSLGTTTVPAFTIMDVTPGNTGTYSVVASAGGCTSPPSNVEVVTIGASLNQAPNIAANDDTPCAGSQLQFSSTSYPGVGVTYEWVFNNGSSTISLGTTTTPSFTINNVSTGYDGSYLVTASTAGCPPQSQLGQYHGQHRSGASADHHRSQYRALPDGNNLPQHANGGQWGAVPVVLQWKLGQHDQCADV